MYKFVASDLDGTLLTSDHKIPDFTQKVLTKLHRQGTNFIFATGRHHIDVAYMGEQLGIPAFMITSNGACVHDCQNEMVFEKHIDTNVSAKIIDMVKNDNEININIYRNDGWLRSKETATEGFNYSGFSYKIFDVNNPPVKDIYKIYLTRDDNNHQKLAAWETKLKAKFAHKTNIAFSSPYCLEIMDVGVSKGYALDVIAKMKGYQLKDCIAFGDGMNDFEMLSMAGKGVVMGAAHFKVKLALPDHEVIGDCDDQAVAHYIVKHLLK
jgi:Cof subfamily protein (haloacid dehalogenase superfamily)